MRALADVFADAVAPDMSGRIADARWITILSWCLTHSHEAFRAAGGTQCYSRDEQGSRYDWLRPLELLWVARTILLTDDWSKRQLPGVRGVRRWSEGPRKRADGFGLTVDQLNSYRQSGAYGAYRRAFRKWPALTIDGDGWTPGKPTLELASWMDAALRRTGAHWQESKHAEWEPQRNSKGERSEIDSWLKLWSQYDAGTGTSDKNTLPRPRGDHQQLPEAKLLRPLIFGEDGGGKRRSEIAQVMWHSEAQDVLALCDDIGDQFPDHLVLSRLGKCARLIEGGLSLMDLIAESLMGETQIPLAVVLEHPAVRDRCETLREAALVWLRTGDASIKHGHQASRFAEVMAAGEPDECVVALLRHHERHASGKRWFLLRDGHVLLRSPQRGAAAMNWFRIGPLARLAAQVGETDGMPDAFDDGLMIDDDLIDGDADGE
jgi:hypothetical protein